MTEQVSKSGVIIFDLDGCVIDDEHRLGLIDQNAVGDSKYAKYHEAMKYDAPLEAGKKYLDDAISHKLFIAFVTARPISLMHATIEQIEILFGLKNSIDFSLFMRPTGDSRPSPILKDEIGRGLIEWAKGMGTQIVSAFDDRTDVVCAYLALGITAFVLDKNGSNAPMLSVMSAEQLAKFRGESSPKVDADVVDADLIDPSKPEMDLLGLNPADDGPVQPQRAMPGSPEPSADHWNIGAILKGASETFDSRAQVYGRNDIMYGQVMAILFPNGLLATEPDEHRKAMFVMHIVGKLTRFAASGFMDKDSIHDIVTYAAMAEANISSPITPTNR